VVEAGVAAGFDFLTFAVSAVCWDFKVGGGETMALWTRLWPFQPFRSWIPAINTFRSGALSVFGRFHVMKRMLEKALEMNMGEAKA